MLILFYNTQYSEKMKKYKNAKMAVGIPKQN